MIWSLVLWIIDLVLWTFLILPSSLFKMETLKSSLSLETHLKKKNLTNQRSIIWLPSSSSRSQRISGRKRLTLPLGVPWMSYLMFFDTGTDGDITTTRLDINYQSPPLQTQTGTTYSVNQLNA